jgi:hypothetical protein
VTRFPAILGQIVPAILGHFSPLKTGSKKLAKSSGLYLILESDRQKPIFAKTNQNVGLRGHNRLFQIWTLGKENIL